MSTCGGCRGINCYNGTIDREENVFNNNFENYDNLFEKLFNHKCNDSLLANYRVKFRNFVTSKILFMTTVKVGNR